MADKVSPNTANAAHRMVDIFDKDGNPVSVTRLNAVDLIRSGNYFWNTADASAPVHKEKGTAEPTVTMYSPKGDPVKVTKGNVRDLVSMGYTTSSDDGTKTDPSPVDTSIVDDAAEEVSVNEENEGDNEEVHKEEEEEEVEASEETSEEAPVIYSTLEEEAQKIAGTGPKEYLKGFSAEALRGMIQERFNEKPHHRSSKAKLIDQFIELEENKNSGDDQADA